MSRRASGLGRYALFLVMLRDAAFVVDTVLAWHGLRIDGPMPRVKA